VPLGAALDATAQMHHRCAAAFRAIGHTVEIRHGRLGDTL